MTKNKRTAPNPASASRATRLARAWLLAEALSGLGANNPGLDQERNDILVAASKMNRREFTQFWEHVLELVLGGFPPETVDERGRVLSMTPRQVALAHYRLTGAITLAREDRPQLCLLLSALGVANRMMSQLENVRTVVDLEFAPVFEHQYSGVWPTHDDGTDNETFLQKFPTADAEAVKRSYQERMRVGAAMVQSVR